jgi:hypothetical protein
MKHLHRAAPLIVLLAAACDAGSSASPSVESELDVLRETLSIYELLENAVADGYEQLTECMEQPPDGGMGYHFVNRDYLVDGVEPDRPEMLLYEPQPDGSLRLVAIEYYVPFRTWSSDTPPIVLGRELAAHGDLDAYVLHVWLWKDNPAGIFADWNPDVSCAHAVEAADRHTH